VNIKNNDEHSQSAVSQSVCLSVCLAANMYSRVFSFASKYSATLKESIPACFISSSSDRFCLSDVDACYDQTTIELVEDDDEGND
jgi:hypothetical protein